MSDRATNERAIFAEEALIADVQFVIHNLMLDKGVSRSELASALNVSQARVSQMFSDNANNLTLRTVARIFHVLGETGRVTCDRWETILADAGLDRKDHPACLKQEHPQRTTLVRAVAAGMMEFVGLQRKQPRATKLRADVVEMMELVERQEPAFDYSDGAESNDNREVDALAA